MNLLKMEIYSYKYL